MRNFQGQYVQFLNNVHIGIKVLKLRFTGLLTCRRLVEQFLRKRTLKTPLLPTSNSISRRLEVASDVISGVEVIGTEACYV